MVLIPLWTNFVIRVYAWMMLLRKEGAINILIGSVADLFNIPFQPLEMRSKHWSAPAGKVLQCDKQGDKSETCAISQIAVPPNESAGGTRVRSLRELSPTPGAR